jgi:hypothetical protein
MINIKTMLLLLGFSSFVTPIEKLKPHPQPPINYSSLPIDFIKIFLCSCYVIPFWTDSDAIKKTIVYCNNCNYPMSWWQTYARIIITNNFKLVRRMKPLMYEGSVDKMNEFLLKIHSKNETDCPFCSNYHGWHINRLKLQNSD